MSTNNEITTRPTPQQIVTEMLQRVPEGQASLERFATPAMARRVQTLERQAPTLTADASRAGSEIEFLGMNPIFNESRLYAGGGLDNDWVFGPADDREDVVVPKQERLALKRLSDAGIRFPLIYVAHEVPKAKSKDLVPSDGSDHTALDVNVAKELVGPVPPPAASVELGERLAKSSVQVIKNLRRGAIAAGAVAAAPVVLAGGALLAASQMVDPVVIGAIPAATSRPGTPAAWYVLARWDW